MSGGIRGLPGTGRRSSRQAAPAATRRQKRSPGVLLLERNLPAPRVQAEQCQGGRMPHMLPARRADDEEVAHDPRLAGQPADQGQPGQAAIADDHVAAPVGITEVGRQPTGLVQPVVIRRRPSELRHVMAVQLP